MTEANRAITVRSEAHHDLVGHEKSAAGVDGAQLCTPVHQKRTC
jgi:hypothetical protein